MTAPRTLHQGIDSSHPTFNLKLNGRDVNPEYQVISAVVTRGINKISTADIILHDGDPASSEFPASDSSDFIPGVDVEIEMGYANQNNTVFKGIITAHSVKIRRDQPSLLHLTCKHKAVKLTVGRKNNIFYKKKDSEIIKTLGGSAGVSVSVEATTDKHPEMVQFYSTDWDFMLSRAEANGLFVFTEDTKISVKKPAFSAAPKLSLLYGATIFDFDAEIDARSQYSAVKASAWDAATQKVKKVSGRNPNATTPGNLSSGKLSDTIGLNEFSLNHTGQIPDTELQQWANAQWLRSQMAKVRGTVCFQGHDGILPGDMIELEGVGNRFNGKVFVSGVRHEFNQYNWETTVSFGLNPKWFHEEFEDIVSTPAEGLLPAAHGLTIGIVTKLENDPDGEDRVRVTMPLIDPSGEGVWARVACLDAGKERGSFFRPEINDEVVLGFLDDDPRNPVILGQLNSSKNPAPVQAADTNHEKGFYTRDKLKLVFNDEKKSITLETPGGQSLIIDDDAGSIEIKDKNGNKIVLDSSGISLESAKDIIVKSSTATKIESGTDLGLKAGTSLKAEGSAGAELSTSAVATIKGSMVKIN